VADVVGLAKAAVAARKAATAVPVEQRSPQRRRNRPRLGSDVDDVPVLIVFDHHSTRVTRQALGRFCRNASAIFNDRLAGLIGIL
jgi:hypothetical protein